jgi:hypothetical protein
MESDKHLYRSLTSDNHHALYHAFGFFMTRLERTTASQPLLLIILMVCPGFKVCDTVDQSRGLCYSLSDLGTNPAIKKDEEVIIMSIRCIALYVCA